MRIPGNSLANLPIWFDTRITKRPCFGNSRFPQRAQIMELFQTLNDEGVTVVMITHDIDVANHAKRVLHILDGQFAEQHIPEKKEAEA